MTAALGLTIGFGGGLLALVLVSLGPELRLAGRRLRRLGRAA